MTDEIKSAVESNNRFAFDLYSKLSEEGENLLFSPWSISTALAMTYEGARGKTAEEMAATLYLEKDDDIRRSSFAAVHKQLNHEDMECKLHTANALWVQKDFQLLDEYTDVIQKYYAGETTNVDFKKALENARRTINSWVEKETNNKIKDLFPKGSLTKNIRLALTNAIYFNGDWNIAFNKSETVPLPFRLSPNKTVDVQTMNCTGRHAVFNYAETDTLQILEMPYKGEELSMLVLLTKDDNLQNLEASLSIDELYKWRSGLAERRVEVFFPKFTFKNKYDLDKKLKKMGMPLAFSKKTDFSGIDGSDSLSIDKVIHQAFVDVNEEGTEAAATGVTVGLRYVGPSIPVFHAEHPFCFMIQERGSGNILFMGRVVNPNL
jgi:serpin B